MKAFWTALVGLLVIVVIAAILFPVFAVAGTGHHRPPVMSNMKQLAVGSIIYATDFDDRFPPADHWMTATLPIVKNKSIFNDPSLDSGKFGYAFYTPASCLLTELIENPREVPLIIQSQRLAANAHADLRGLPTTPRMGGGKFDAYANADSSVKVRPRTWAEKPPTIKIKRGGNFKNTLP